MRIALVNPVARRTEGYHTVGSHIPHLGLQVLAAATPAGHAVEIVDEIFGQDRTSELLVPGRFDLVGITGYTSGATRAYELAALCRSRGMRCVFGGSHASARIDEAAAHFDSVAVGECDEIWPQIVADAQAGSLKPLYEGRLADLSAGFGRADQRLQPLNGRYDVSCIQTSRGCPVGCEFCSVTSFNGAKIRRRPIDSIIEEWNATPRRFLFVVDDNFFGVSPSDIAWAKELLSQIIRRGKRRLWFSQTTANMGNDVEALRLAYRAGCRGMLVGFETFDPAGLRTFGKGLNYRLLSRYRQLVAGFHRAGLAVFGGFIVGLDCDTEDTVAETALRAAQMGVDIIQITNLTPLPGTRLYDRYVDEGRIFACHYPQDWERYTFVETVYSPAGISAGLLDQTIHELRTAAAVERWVWKRTLRTAWFTRSLSTAAFVHGMNKGWVRMARRQVARDAARFDPAAGSARRSAMIRRAFSLRSGRADS